MLKKPVKKAVNKLSRHFTETKNSEKPLKKHMKISISQVFSQDNS